MTIVLLVAAATCLVGGVVFAYTLHVKASTKPPPTSQNRFEIVAIVGSWAAMMAVIQFGESYAKEPPYLLWAWTMLAVAVVIGAATTLVVIDVRRRWRVDTAVAPIDVAGFVVGASVWLLGGLGLFAWFISFSGVGLPVHCRLPGIHGEFHCLTPEWGEGIGVAVALSATPAVAVLGGVGIRSRVAVWLSPVIIVGLYVLARLFWGPRLD